MVIFLNHAFVMVSYTSAELNLNLLTKLPIVGCFSCLQSFDIPNNAAKLSWHLLCKCATITDKFQEIEMLGQRDLTDDR
jgi:hypothetical protein